MKITAATCLWDSNDKSESFSRGYDESWVEKLYRGFARNLTVHWDFVCYTDRIRSFKEPGIEQRPLKTSPPHYGCFIEPFASNDSMILVGLDTIIVGNIDHMARYLWTDMRMALPRDPYQLDRSINGVALIPAGNQHIFREWDGKTNDMEHLRKYDWNKIDALFPGEVLSLKAHDVRGRGLQSARIVYFHGNPKPNELDLPWVKEHWR
jgi:hypothetical protein